MLVYTQKVFDGIKKKIYTQTECLIKNLSQNNFNFRVNMFLMMFK